ncbi:hypothetical protein [uncultured Paraglaciecola sp.]|uniref:hypothetical protein n=1 Tax=uncultured Paraglaciecola sp. TaxID=1765024 RepID=UPI0030DBA8FD|tara:strand:- start:97753 stop:98697 length:945 start_codon:yes stop_codon:yes gene_type:complete
MDFIKIVAVICTCIGTSIAVYRFFRKAPSEKEAKQAEDIPETIATRLVALFESHGVHRNQIPEFFGHGLDIATCGSDEKLLDKITPEIINDAVVLFGVKKDWLEGSSKEIYDIPDFYKHPEEFEQYLVELLKNTPKDKLFAYALTSNKNLMRNDDDSIFVIAECIGELNQRKIYKYHLLGRWGIHYWKARAYFAACCSLFYKHGLLVAGKTVDYKWILDMCSGEKLLSYDFSEQYGGISLPAVKTWIVSDFVEIPEKYLEGMDTERGAAIPFALCKWLDLNEKGYMRCTSGHEDFHADVVDFFRKKINLIKDVN